MGEQITLSISLLASNRKETIRRCLDSLKPIMEQVSSELIIVDTGCDADTQAILKEYTEQIIPFVWCDDFSKARNAGLKEAKGEWFMFIDDDEWFLDVRDIVDFFMKGEYREYGLANYIVRNFTNAEGTKWEDCWVTRMVRRTTETRFRSRIHEYMDPVQGDTKLLKSTAGHFGYLFDSQEKLYRHAQRNISQLLEMLEEEPDQTRWWTQLAQEYKGIKEYHRMYELCREGIRHFKDMDTAQINRDRGTFYVGCVMADLIRGLREEAVKDYEGAIEDSRNTEACQAALHFNGAVAYVKGERYEEAARCCRSYLKSYKRLRGDDMELLRQGTFFVRDSFRDADRVNACAYLMISECKLGKNMALKQYFKKFGWKEEKIYFNYELIPVLIDFWAKAEYDEFYSRAAELLMGCKGVDKVTVDCLWTKETVAPEEDFLRLARIFSSVKSDHPYIAYLRILYQDSIGSAVNPEDFRELFGGQIDFLCLPEKFWRIVERSGVNLFVLFAEIKFDRWRCAVDALAEKSDRKNIERRREMLKNWGNLSVFSENATGNEISVDNTGAILVFGDGSSERGILDGNAAAHGFWGNVHYDYFRMKTMEALLVKGDEDVDYEGLRQKLLEYVDSQLKFYGQFFNDNAFMGEMEMLPLPCRLAVRLGEALLEEQEGDRKAVLERYRDCLGIFPPMNDVIKKYAHLYKERTDERKKMDCEMEKLGREMKQRIRFLMEQGMISEAEEALHRLKGFLPRDKELDTMEQELQIHA